MRFQLVEGDLAAVDDLCDGIAGVEADAPLELAPTDPVAITGGVAATIGRQS